MYTFPVPLGHQLQLGWPLGLSLQSPQMGKLSFHGITFVATTVPDIVRGALSWSTDTSACSVSLLVRTPLFEWHILNSQLVYNKSHECVITKFSEALWFFLRPCEFFWGLVIFSEALWFFLRPCDLFWGLVIFAEAMWFLVLSSGFFRLTTRAVLDFG